MFSELTGRGRPAIIALVVALVGLLAIPSAAVAADDLPPLTCVYCAPVYTYDASSHVHDGAAHYVQECVDGAPSVVSADVSERVPGTATVLAGRLLLVSGFGVAADSGMVLSGHGGIVAGDDPVVTVPDYILAPPDGLVIEGNPVTVDAPTRLSDLLSEDIGMCHWAACRRVYD